MDHTDGPRGSLLDIAPLLATSHVVGAVFMVAKRSCKALQPPHNLKCCILWLKVREVPKWPPVQGGHKPHRAESEDVGSRNFRRRSRPHTFLGLPRRDDRIPDVSKGTRTPKSAHPPTPHTSDS